MSRSKQDPSGMLALTLERVEDQFRIFAYRYRNLSLKKLFCSQGHCQEGLVYIQIFLILLLWSTVSKLFLKFKQ